MTTSTTPATCKARRCSTATATRSARSTRSTWTRQTGQPEWALVKTGLFGTKRTFVPIHEAPRDGDDVRVPYEKAQVKDAPNIDADGALASRGAAALRALRPSTTATPRRLATRAGDATRTDATARRPRRRRPGHRRRDDALRGGAARRHHRAEAGRARLRKYVVTEKVDQDGPGAARGGARRARADHRRQPRRGARRPRDLRGGARGRAARGAARRREERGPEGARAARAPRRSPSEETVSETVRKEHIDDRRRRASPSEPMATDLSKRSGAGRRADYKPEGTSGRRRCSPR